MRTLILGRRPAWTLARAVVWVVVLLLASRFVLLPVRVEGISMLPTYKARQVNLINKFAYSRHEPQRGDVVAIRFSGEHIMLLKRVIGLPGETVGFLNGRAMVDGEPLAEPYVKLPCNWNRAPVELGPDEYFVVGDNRSMAKENHEFGRAKRERIVGKAIL